MSRAGRSARVDVGATVRQAWLVDHMFSLAEARGVRPEVLKRADEVIAVRADLVELQAALEQGLPAAHLGGLAEAKGFQAHLSELLGWLPVNGIEVKSIAPLLLDFPAEMDGETVLLCWLEGERQLPWYHKPDHGFAGRRLIPVGWE